MKPALSRRNQEYFCAWLGAATMPFCQATATVMPSPGKIPRGYGAVFIAGGIEHLEVAAIFALISRIGCMLQDILAPGGSRTTAVVA